METQARKGLQRVLFAGLLGAAMAASSAAALAQAPGDMGWYVGASLGQTEVNLDCTGTTACDDKDSSWKIFAGYQFVRNFALEFGYTDLGGVTAATPAIGVIPPASVAIERTRSTSSVCARSRTPTATRISHSASGCASTSHRASASGSNGSATAALPPQTSTRVTST